MSYNANLMRAGVFQQYVAIHLSTTYITTKIPALAHLTCICCTVKVPSLILFLQGSNCKLPILQLTFPCFER